MAFRTLTPKELETNLFRMIDDEWLLICCNDRKKQRENMMTASWGGMGILWNKQVCFLFVRPQRYTHSLLEAESRLSLCVLPRALRSAHKVCGSQSGRDVDKIAATGLTEIEVDGVKALEEAEYIFVIKQLYVDALKKACFTDSEVLKHYPDDDFHSVYICEIEKILQKE